MNKKTNVVFSNPPTPISIQEYHPTNTTTHKHSVDRWFNFIAGFSPEFVQQCLNQSSSKLEMVLDPFSGCGTVQVQANKMGWRSCGYDPHPVFNRIASAKALASDQAGKLPDIVDTISSGFSHPASIGTLPPKPQEYLSKLFSSDTLECLLGAKLALRKSKLEECDLAFLILSRVLDLCSKSQTDGIYKAPTSSKRASVPHEALTRVSNMVQEDLSFYQSNDVRIIQKSSVDMGALHDTSVSAVITSPPYLNNFDYAEMTRMYLYFWDIADSWGDISEKVRSNLIVNTTTALKGQKERQNEYRDSLPDQLLPECDKLVDLLVEQRKSRAGKKEYDYLIYPYFAQMKRVLEECMRVLEPNGAFHMMVADAALYGIHISAPQILSEILRHVGFSNVRCEFVRKRGHRWVLDKRDGSKQGLGEYYIYAEKIV